MFGSSRVDAEEGDQEAGRNYDLQSSPNVIGDDHIEEDEVGGGRVARWERGGMHVWL